MWSLLPYLKTHKKYNNNSKRMKMINRMLLKYRMLNKIQKIIYKTKSMIKVRRILNLIIIKIRQLKEQRKVIVVEFNQN